MKKLVIFFIAVISTTSLVIADNIDKLSAGTQMFLSERKGEVRLPKLNQKLPAMENADDLLFFDEELKTKVRTREIAETEMVRGVEMISAFVRVNSGGFSAVEGLGAVMQTKFNDNLAAMLLPVDKIEAIADLSNVTGIEVAEILQPFNDKQREVTQDGDAISNSAAAQALGLTKQYTGKNVILGIIDTGIDFQHIAFKDKNGNSRIVRAYKLSGSNSTSLTTYSSATQISSLTYDTNTEDHGTHTSSTAGGSSVIVNGSTVTVTDDHANATYGGMAPEADLVIAGLSSLYTTSIGSAIQNICNYADQVGKPCVISLSLGSQAGPHDGTGSIASIVNQYAGNNHIIVYAASNDGMRADYFVNIGTSNGGGMYASGTSTKSKPMMVNLQKSWSNATGNVQLYSASVYAYARTSNVPTALKLHVVDTSTGNIVYSTSEYTSSNTISVSSNSGLAQYFSGSGSISVSRSTTNNKYYWTISSPSLKSTSYSQNSSGVYESKYALCISVYPTGSNSSTIIDMWEGSRVNWFGNDLTLSSTYSNNYNVVDGNDECSVSDNACYSKVISVGAYVTRNSVTNYEGTVTDASDDYPNIGDHAYFSSWQSLGYGPLGTALPHINAPGARIIAGVNHYHTATVDDYSYYSDNYKTDLVVNSTSYPYGAMEGTSMATPCVSGIIALWLQACVEAGKTPSPDYIKEVMQNTWDTDQWTNGAGHGAKTFGTHGKINAIKGIQYILGTSAGPLLTVSPTTLNFGEAYVGDASPTKAFNVKGVNLTGNVTLSLNDPNGVFSLSETSITKANATSGRDIIVTFTPKGNATYTGTVTISSSGADPVIVTLNATGKVYTPTIAASPTSLSFNGNSGNTYSKTVSVTSSHLQGNVTATIQNDANGFYSVSPTSFNAASQTVTVTWAPTAGGTSTANLVLTTTGTGANTVTIPITGTAQGPTIAANPSSITFNGYVTQTYTQAVTVTGTNLSQNISASITGANVYSIDKTSLTKTGGTITVTYAPTTAGTTNAALTLSSTGASIVTVPITGTAQAATPTLMVTPTSLTFSPDVNIPESKTFAVSGRFINEDVTITLNDPSGVFALEQATIPAVSISETNAVNVTVTFQSADEGDFTGLVTVASAGAASQTVNLSATVSTGGTASDAYLNIAKYATIDEAGATVSGMSSIYKYTEYEDNGYAWLTLSNYGAMQADANQNWYTTGSLTSYRNTWDASDIFLGDDTYFGSNQSYSIYGSANQIFFVTNCTQVKALVKGGGSSSSKATLSIYECTKNADGSVSASNTAFDIQQSTAASSTEIVTSAVLDASQVYKVQLTGGGNYPDLLEIGFQTELNNPAIKVDPIEINYITLPGVSIIKSFTVTGKKLTQDVTLTLTDPDNHYVISTTTINLAEALAGATVSVTFNAPKRTGSYRAVVNLSSGDLTNHVNLYGSVGAEGTAFSEYLDITKHSTIGLNNWYEGYIDNPYKYTENETDNNVWLTLPVIMARYAWFYDDQNWLFATSGNYMIHSSETEGLDWSARDVFPGDDYYFTSTKSYGLGGTDQSNTEMYYTVYNITNCSQVKAYGYNGSSVKPYSWSSTSYPAMLQIYELTENADGTLTVADDYVDNKTSTTNSSDIVLTSIELDPSKIYRVYVAGYRSYFYEVAFRAPLITTEATLADIERDGYPGNRFKISDELVAIYADAAHGLLWCKDQGNASIDATEKKDGQIDYMREVTKEQVEDWDQSNWVALKFPTDNTTSLSKDIEGKKIAAGSVTGRYIDDWNYTFDVFPVDNNYTLSTGEKINYIKNLYCPANFLDENLNLTEESTGAVGHLNGKDYYYFFMNPKIHEVCEITYAVWDGEKFVVPTPYGIINNTGIPGAFTVDWTYNEFKYDQVINQLSDQQAYRFMAVVHRTDNSDYGYVKSVGPMEGVDASRNLVVMPLNLSGGDDNIVTAINNIYTDGYREVVGVEYVNVAGMISDKPFQGVNIVVTRYSDGSKTTSKKVFK